MTPESKRMPRRPDAAVGSTVVGNPRLRRQMPNLPSTMIWSVYDVGASGYVEASAIADALGKAYGTRVRLQLLAHRWRILPVKERRVSHGWLATEVFFAAEGLFEYAAPNWGPQDLRCLLGRRVNSLSICVTKSSGIKKLSDSKAKRTPIAKANTSVNAKIEPILDAAGISYKDRPWSSSQVMAPH